MKGAYFPIIIRKFYPVLKEKVWNALTNLEEMNQWFFPNISGFKASVGFETKFLISNEGRNFTHIWKALEVIQNQKLIPVSYTHLTLPTICSV